MHLIIVKLVLWGRGFVGCHESCCKYSCEKALLGLVDVHLLESWLMDVGFPGPEKKARRSHMVQPRHTGSVKAMLPARDRTTSTAGAWHVGRHRERRLLKTERKECLRMTKKRCIKGVHHYTKIFPSRMCTKSLYRK